MGGAKLQAKTGADDRLGKIESEVGLVKHRLKHIEGAGGHADTKTLSKRCMRIEQRIEKLERQAERQAIITDGLHGAMRSVLSALADHLKDRHEQHLITGRGLDVDAVRIARKRIDAMGQELAAIDKRTPA